jgi:hypothetical protein
MTMSSTSPPATTVVLIHGLWVTPLSYALDWASSHAGTPAAVGA